MCRLFSLCLCLLLLALTGSEATSSLRAKRGVTERRCDDACRRAIGICPPSNRLPMMMGCTEMCEKDHDCSKGLKCCDGGCGKVCLSPLVGGCMLKGHYYAEGSLLPLKYHSLCYCVRSRARCGRGEIGRGK